MSEETVSVSGAGAEARGGGRRATEEKEEAKDGDKAAPPLTLTLAVVFSILDVEQDREEGDRGDDENAELALVYFHFVFFL